MTQYNRSRSAAVPCRVGRRDRGERRGRPAHGGHAAGQEGQDGLEDIGGGREDIQMHEDDVCQTFNIWQNGKNLPHSTEKAGGDMIKIVDTFLALYHVR